jgi:hypothetical protein
VLHVVTGVHSLATQDSPSGQTLPQCPQSLLSLVVSTHPDAQHCSVPPQGGPPSQVNADWQLPMAQTSSGAHGLPQPPQLAGSVSVSVQPEVQHVWPIMQDGPPLQAAGVVHTLASHIELGQATPHLPQLFGSSVVSVQPPGQQVSSPVQAGSPWQDGPVLHSLSTHVDPGVHAKSQLPQLLGSVEVSTQPAGQHLSVGEQTGPPLQLWGVKQPPATQVAPVGHRSPQWPQLSGSLLVSTHPLGQH